MDSLFFLPDTITVNVVKVIDSCQPCAQMAESNNGLWIALIICLSIVAITLIIGVTIIRCKKAALSSKAEMERIKNENEEKKKK